MATAAARSACRPRLYVHYLPENYRDPADRVGRGVGAPLVPLADVSTSLEGFPKGVHLFDTQQYQLGELFYERAIAYRCRTHDPSLADLFFVPAFSGRVRRPPVDGERGARYPRAGLVPRFDALFERVHALRAPGTNESYLSARGGADHIVVRRRRLEYACIAVLTDHLRIRAVTAE